MKRLLGLLLVMGTVGCGDPVVRLEDKAAKITKNEQGEVVEVDLSYNTRMTDAGMADLKGLTNLQQLNLDGTQVTDAGLVHLKGMPQLQFLGLPNTKLTNAGIVELQQALPKCEIHK